MSVGLSDAALGEQAAHCGRMLQIAMQAGDRDAALVWQQAMVRLARLRLERLGLRDTSQAKG